MQTQRARNRRGSGYRVLVAATAVALAGEATSEARLSTTHREVSQSQSRLGRASPARSFADPTGAPADTTCEGVIREVDQIVLAAPQGEEANAAHQRLRNAATDAGCRAKISARALRAPCGAGLGIVTSALFGHRATAPSEVVPHVDRAVRELRRGDGACVQAVLPSVQYVTRVDRSLVEAVSALSQFKSVNARSARLLTLGSLSFIARRGRDQTLQDSIEGTLLAELRSGPTDHIAIDAAGNAACERCQPALGAARKSTDAWVRGAAASSDRFIANGGAADRMCAALADEASHVRSEAAWALSFGVSAIDSRRSCLVRAVRSDSDLGVRLAAARALTVLASVSPSVARALNDLHDESLPTEVRVVILEHLTSGTPAIVQEANLDSQSGRGT